MTTTCAHGRLARKCEICELDELERECERLRTELDQERLRYGQQRARNAVFMRALASIARQGHSAFAQRTVALADEAAKNVRLDDFTVAKVAKVTKGSDK
jgi:hypothetical protein